MLETPLHALHLCPACVVKPLSQTRPSLSRLPSDWVCCAVLAPPFLRSNDVLNGVSTASAFGVIYPGSFGAVGDTQVRAVCLTAAGLEWRQCPGIATCVALHDGAGLLVLTSTHTHCSSIHLALSAESVVPLPFRHCQQHTTACKACYPTSSLLTFHPPPLVPPTPPLLLPQLPTKVWGRPASPCANPSPLEPCSPQRVTLSYGGLWMPRGASVTVVVSALPDFSSLFNLANTFYRVKNLVGYTPPQPGFCTW